MIYYNRLANAIGQPGAKQLVITPEGEALGAIPGWNLLLDPEHMINPNTIRNRARRGGQAVNNDTIVLSTFGNDTPAFAPVSDNLIRAPFNSAPNSEAWSVFSVFQFSPSAALPRIFSPVTDTDEGDVALQIGFSANGDNLFVYSEGRSTGAVQRLSASVNLSTTGLTPNLFIFTGSTRDGLRIYRNGTVIAENPDDKRALNAAINPGEMECFRGTRGLWGMTGLLDIDLGWAEHSAYRRRIEAIMATKYGITMA